MQGGKVRLEVDLDGRGAAEKSGVLWIEDFRVLGDPIVSEVYSSAEVSGPAIDSTPSGPAARAREVFDFDAHERAVLRRPRPVRARGILRARAAPRRLDPRQGRLTLAAHDLGGTYVPLQGINSALAAISRSSDRSSPGLDCEGVFGITYAIQGPMAQPQVIVNPLAMFTPGILRDIFEMTIPNPKVQRRDEAPSPAAERTRARHRVAASVGRQSSEDTHRHHRWVVVADHRDGKKR